MTRRLLIAAAAAAAAAAGVVAGASATHPPVRYYLALGDSLSQGVQPDVRDVSRDTDQGYADQLFAIERRRIPGLRLVKLGCGGETTSSMISGHSNGRNARAFHCRPAGGSQLGAAERFLRAHHRAGEVALVTIDIGANDVDGCVHAGPSLGSCIAAGEASIKHNVPIILHALRHAAPSGTTLAAMTLYDPILAGWFDARPSPKALASASVSVLRAINDELSSAARGAGFRTADVAGAFKSYDSTDTVGFDGLLVPVNVARVCSWTWNCTPPPSGPNIHANKNGYAVIAAAFARALGRLG